MPKGTRRNVVFKDGTQNLYTILGFSDESTSFKEINNDYSKYLKGELGEQTADKTKAFEMLTSQENISKDPKKSLTRKESFDAKLTAEREQQIKDGSMARLDMSKANALSGGATSKFVEEGSKIAKLHKVLGHVTYPHVAENHQPKSVNPNPPSPRGVAEQIEFNEQSQISTARSDEEENAKTHSSEVREVGNKIREDKTKDQEKNKANSSSKNSKVMGTNNKNTKQDKKKNAERIAKEDKERAIYEKLYAARSFASKMRRGFKSDIKLSEKEQLMMDDMMKKELNDINNMSKQDMKDLSIAKRDFRRSQKKSEGRGH
ncbi:MAG: hypothetical protein N4A31_03150 [Rickettsiales bacterium]|jgi:hypothetical protein|nr:hypothetical protein [Rickettsiales bacterium]